MTLLKWDLVKFDFKKRKKDERPAFLQIKIMWEREEEKERQRTDDLFLILKYVTVN
jgi:hypothetical protein